MKKIMTNNVKVTYKNVAFSFFFYFDFFRKCKCYNIIKKGSKNMNGAKYFQYGCVKDERIHHAT